MVCLESGTVSRLPTRDSMKEIRFPRLLVPLLLLIALGIGQPGCTNEPQTNDEVHFFNPVWAPDGKRIVAG